MIEVKNLEIKYGSKVAVAKCDFNLVEGVIYGLVGENGAGKTTLLRGLTKSLKINDGEISYNGVNIKENSNYENEILFLSQDVEKKKGTIRSLIKELKRIRQCEFDDDYFYELKNEFAYKENLNLSKCSRGNSRLINFIVNLCFNPRVIVLDEFFDGVDVVNKSKLKRILYNHIEKVQGLVILSTHNLNEIENMCDKIIFLRHGILGEALDKEELLHNYMKIQIIDLNEMELWTLGEKSQELKFTFHNNTDAPFIVTKHVDVLTYLEEENIKYHILHISVEEVIYNEFI